MSQSFLQMNTVFISILIESLPFILLAVILSGIIQMFVTEEMLAKIIPKNRYLSILVTSLLGALFPACECGIIPITKRLISKGVPLHAGVGFMQTAPVINPIVVMSTYAALEIVGEWFYIAVVCHFLLPLFLVSYYPFNLRTAN